MAGRCRSICAQADLYGDLLNAASVTAQFGEESLDKQLLQVAKTISIRNQLNSERDVFVVQLGGFDTHSDLGDELSGLLGQLNAGLTSFVAELKAQNVWNSVTIATVSDFGRTLTSNGVGTDHAWGGNHFIAGGSVKGGRFHGSFPPSLALDSELNYPASPPRGECSSTSGRLHPARDPDRASSPTR